MNFDLSLIPFSRYGSYITISYFKETRFIEEGLYIRSVHGGDDALGNIFRIELVHLGESISFKQIASPSILRLESEKGYVEICICEPHLIRARGVSVGMRLTLVGGYYDNAIYAGDDRWEINSYSEEIKFMATPIKGSISADTEINKDGRNNIVFDFLPNKNKTYGEFECALEDYRAVWEKRSYNEDFDACHMKVLDDYNKWLENTLDVSHENMEKRELAAYITWSCIVPKKGKITRPAMYMSKNWMTNIWSWDHCFNAMAQIKNRPDIAWDQIMVMVDNQDESGAFPDYVNDKFASWSCTKPPIHGWAIKWMMDRSDFFTKDKIKEIYTPLKRWTNWWLKYRDYDNDGIPQYNDGNESGWDNSTVFSKGCPIESPDLSAYLILQMDALSYMAQVLGYNEESREWKLKADGTLDKMIEHFWRGDRFVSLHSGSHTSSNSESESLILFVPIILGKRLPQYILDSLIKVLKEEGRFLTNYGLATESINSPYYIDDGYWRGPIWAPSTMLIVDGLKSAGEIELAHKVSQRFCKMVRKSGMAENFNAITGEGLRDPAFTWTSSVFLILANEFMD
jgi:glycogen debranching enzyme